MHADALPPPHQREPGWGLPLALALLVLASAAVAGWFVGRWSAKLPAEREE